MMLLYMRSISNWGGFSLLAQGGQSFWLPERASSVATSVDRLFNILLAVSVFFFTLIVVLMAVFVLLYRRRPGQESGESPSYNTMLEITWTSIPLIIVAIIFYMGFT